MPLVMNTRDEELTVKAFGNFYTWKPLQVKFIYETELAHWLVRERRHEGLVELPEELEEHNIRKYPQGAERLPLDAKTKVEDAIQAGREAYCSRLREIVSNLQIALRQDLEQSNIKADPRVFASNGEIHAMEQLIKYQDRGEDAEQKKIDRLKELEKKIKVQA